ncbi:MAG: hypothetical protein V3U13_11710 [Gemmatimonadota bacterium]|jgi:hypothetical protein
MPSRTTLESIALVAAVLGEAAVLYFASDPLLRLVLGLLLLAVIVWSSSRLGFIGFLSQSPTEQIHKRRFVLLRSQVQQLLHEIRRLNWMAVDVERGFRSSEQALREMDAIEERLKEIIADIRSAAGRMSPESEVTR